VDLAEVSERDLRARGSAMPGGVVAAAARRAGTYRKVHFPLRSDRYGLMVLRGCEGGSGRGSADGGQSPRGEGCGRTCGVVVWCGGVGRVMRAQRIT
jgi:hypothetical protein